MKAEDDNSAAAVEKPVAPGLSEGRNAACIKVQVRKKLAERACRVLCSVRMSACMPAVPMTTPGALQRQRARGQSM
jgi:hypothetical protein